MDVIERKRGDRRRLTRLIANESDAIQRDRLRSVLLVLLAKTLSLNGISKLLNRHSFVCLKPRPRDLRQDPAAAKAFKRRASIVWLLSGILG